MAYYRYVSDCCCFVQLQFISCSTYIRPESSSLFSSGPGNVIWTTDQAHLKLRSFSGTASRLCRWIRHKADLAWFLSFGNKISTTTRHQVWISTAGSFDGSLPRLRVWRSQPLYPSWNITWPAFSWADRAQCVFSLCLRLLDSAGQEDKCTLYVDNDNFN